VNYEKPLQIKVLDFPEWLKGELKENQKVVVKMDVEGAEYDILPKLISDGTLQKISELRVEYHWKKFSGISEQKHREVTSAVNLTGIKVVLWK
jgi:hypothetical protein